MCNTFLVNFEVLISTKAAETAFTYDLCELKVTRPEPKSTYHYHTIPTSYHAIIYISVVISSTTVDHSRVVESCQKPTRVTATYTQV